MVGEYGQKTLYGILKEFIKVREKGKGEINKTIDTNIS